MLENRISIQNWASDTRNLVILIIGMINCHFVESNFILTVKHLDLMFVFENLLDVEDRGIQAILREVQQDVLMKAIKGTDDALKDKILANMSKRAAEMMADDLEAMPPVRISEVEAAQKEILSTARRLADSGEIMLGGGGGEEFL